MTNTQAKVASLTMNLAEDILAYESYKHRVEALERWVALLTLDVRPERAELQSAGVPQHTIEALYPYEFDDLAENLEAFFRQPRPADTFDGTHWSVQDDKQQTLESAIPRALDAQCNEDFGKFIDSGAFARLESALREGISEPLRQVKANAMLTNLWSTHWLMAHIDQTDLHQRIYERFTETIDWVLPHLPLGPARIEP